MIVIGKVETESKLGSKGIFVDNVYVQGRWNTMPKYAGKRVLIIRVSESSAVLRSIFALIVIRLRDKK